MKKYMISCVFCADLIYVITNFAVITNAVIKRVLCTLNLFTYNFLHIIIQILQQ